MNWGIKITVLYIGFVILIVSMVMIASSHKVDLVSKDYYAQELNYQERIDATTNERNLKTSISHQILSDGVHLKFDDQEAIRSMDGEILFFRPSDPSKDLKIKLKFNSNGEQFVSNSNLCKGIYKMCISWKKGKQTFYKEEIITL